MILILTSVKEEENAQAVAVRLRERSAEYVVFGYGQFVGAVMQVSQSRSLFH